MNFKKLWPDQLSVTSYMQNLRELIIKKCDGLKYLSSFGVAEKLLQLELLIISDCKDIEEVLATLDQRQGRREEISFPKLKSLVLENLPNLKRFCAGDFVGYPLLSYLYVCNCPKLGKFVTSFSVEEGLEDLDLESKQTFFDEKVTFFFISFYYTW